MGVGAVAADTQLAQSFIAGKGNAKCYPGEGIQPLLLSQPEPIPACSNGRLAMARAGGLRSKLAIC